jgi:putative protease
LELRFANKAVNFRRVRAGDLVWRTHDPEVDRLVRPFIDPPAPVARQPVTVHVTVCESRLLRTRWTLAQGQSVVVESAGPLPLAQNRGLKAETLKEQFGRLGNTAYELANLHADIAGEFFAPASLLNRMRREAVEKLEELQSHPAQRQVFPAPQFHVKLRKPSFAASQLHLLVRNDEQLDAAIAARPDSITLDYLDLFGLRPSVQRAKAVGAQIRVASPRILKTGENRIVDFLASLDCPILIRDTGALYKLRHKTAQLLIGDFSLNAANALAAEIYLELGLTRLTPTHDLNAAQIAALAGSVGSECIEAIAYQHLPVFYTEHCVFCRFLSTGTTHRDCGRPCERHRVALRDSQGRAHPVVADVGCRNTVFGAEAQEASGHMDLWRNSGIAHFRLEFVHESARQVEEVTAAFQAYLSNRINASELHDELERLAPAGVTEGSLFVVPGFDRFPILQ